MNIGAVMDEIAARLRALPSLAGRTYAWSPGDLVSPAAIVSYPGPGTYDLSYQRGADRAEGLITVIVGPATERQTRDLITRYVDGAGAESVKATVDGDGTYVTCDSVTVTGWDFDLVPVGASEELAATFTLDIVGRGTQ